MAMDVKNSERLLSSILDSARAEADAILAQGKERAGAIQAEAQAEAARIAQEAEAKAMAARTDVLERSRTNAGLDARKAALASGGQWWMRPLRRPSGPCANWTRRRGRIY